MRITLCGSITFHKEMFQLKKKLEEKGHIVYSPDLEIAKGRDTLISDHFRKIEWADDVLIVNYSKKGIDGYIGGSTLMEMAVAFYLKKPIYLLNQIPEFSYKEEILGMKPILLNGIFRKYDHYRIQTKTRPD